MSPVIKKFNWWYESLIDWMISNPDQTREDAAVHFNCSPQTLYLIQKSDMFKERLAQRRAELSSTLREEIVERTARVANKGLKLIEARLDQQDVEKTPLLAISEITDKALKNLGYGVKNQPSVVINNVVETGASPSTLLEARAKLRESQFSTIRQEAVTVEVLEEEFLQPELPLGPASYVEKEIVLPFEEELEVALGRGETTLSANGGGK